MALTVTTISPPHARGDRFESVTKIAFDSSYTTGGYSLTPAMLGFAATTDPEFTVECDNALGWNTVYDYVNQKVLLYAATVTANAQVTATTDCSAANAVRVVATGKFRA